MKILILFSLILVNSHQAFAAPHALEAGERLIKHMEDLASAPARQKQQTEILLKVGAQCVENFDELAKKAPQIQKDFEAVTAEAHKILEPIEKDAKTDVDQLQKLVDDKDCSAKMDPLVEELYEKTNRLQAVEFKMEALEKKMYKVRNLFLKTFDLESGAVKERLKLKPASCPSDYRAAYEKAFANEESERKIKEVSAFYTAMDDIWLSKGAAHDLSGTLYNYHSMIHDVSCQCGRPAKKCETFDEHEERVHPMPSSSGN
jgi:ATP-dependent Lon protease